jgi:hypothetical protein
MAATEQIVIKSPEPQDDPAHVAAMVAKVDGVEVPAETPSDKPADAPAGERPAWLPEKFKSVEDMAKAYAELEAKQSGKPADTPAEKPADAPKAGEQPAEKEVKEELDSKGLNLDDFSNEFSQTGQLSPESYAKLEKAGYPKGLVDQYIEGQKALAATYEADIKASAGGAEKWDQVAAWAAENLTDADKVAFNKAIDSKDVATAKLAVQGLTAKFDAANPSEGNLLSGRFSNAVSDKYESVAQVTEDMRNPKYQSDPAFRRKVEEKLARSDIM